MGFLSNEQKSSIISDVVAFVQKTVDEFLQKQSDKTFYAFAFDCNLEYAELGVCLNTEKDFLEVLHLMQKEYPDSYQDSERIIDLKYNTGDWAYQCIDSISFLSEEYLDELHKTFNFIDNPEVYQEFLDELYQLACQSLDAFLKTKSYQDIPKTKDFATYIIDHDEDYAEALRKNQKYRCVLY